MSNDGSNPWGNLGESKEETKDEPVENAASESLVEEPTLAPPEPQVVPSPMTPLGEARRASDLRNADAVLKDLENRYAQLRGEKDQAQSEFEHMQNQLNAALEENKRMREALQGKEKEAEESQREALIHKEKSTTLELDCKVKDERLSRLTSEADALREEISRLTESTKTAKSAIADMESQAKLVSAESIPLQYQVQRLQTDLDSLNAHAKWLDSELVRRNDQIEALTKENSSKVYDLQTELNILTEKKTSYEADIEALRRSNSALESKVEKLASENLQLKQEASDAKLEAEQNLIAEHRVIELQKEQLELLEKRHDDVVRQMESMKAAARAAAEESRSELEAIREQVQEDAKRVIEEQAEGHRARIEELEAKLEESNRLRHEAEDFMIESPARASRRTLAAITAGEEQKQADEEDQLPLNLTDAYTLLRKTEQELREERKNHKLAQLRLRRIEEDVKAKMPHYIRQRQEYETAVARDQESRQRMKQALADVATYRREAQEALHDVARLQRDNRRLEAQVANFAIQIQGLLGREVPDSTPLSIAEIQQQNRDLLGEHHLLKEEIQALKSDPLRSKLVAAEKEIEYLKEERQRSELYVASIVQQRDLLRAQLHLDSKVRESESEQATPLAFSAQHSERIKELEAKNTRLEDDLGKYQAEAVRFKSEKDAAADRLLRYEAQVTTLSETVDSYLAQVAAAKAEGARMGADAAYHRDKCLRLEDSLQRSIAEVARVTEAKTTLQNHSARLQEALSEANASCSRLKQDLSQTERTLRLAETQAESAKSAETRVALEADRLRAEMARHGSLVETVHRIEASLTAKAVEESKRFEEEISRLREQLSSEQSKYSVEVESVKGRVHQLEAELKELTKKKDDALTDLIRTKEKMDSSKAEIEALSSKCGRLESQLRSAKNRLGETEGDDEDVEASLQAKIDALSNELEAANAELIAAKESVAIYQKIAKESEDALAELTKATDAFKASRDAETAELQKQLAAAKQESASRQDAVIELTKDLSGLREEHGKEVGELRKQITQWKNDTEQLRKDADGASKLVEHMKVDIGKLQEQASAAQKNYDRELSMHADAVTKLREARDELESVVNAKNAVEGQVQGLQVELTEKQKAWDEEKASLKRKEEELEKNVSELRTQIDVLHSQLQQLGALVEKSQEDRIVAATAAAEGGSGSDDSKSDELGALQKSVSELRELIRFLRSEKEMLQVQLDAARRTADRERAAAAVARRSLDEARNELSVLQNNEAESNARPSSAQPSDQTERIRTLQEQVQLLHDSNRLLREESEKLEKSLATSQLELAEAKRALDPFEQKQLTLEVEKAGLEAEKDSLLRENEAWKGRLQSLVSKFNQIDPVEHENVLKQVESLKKDVETLRTQKKATDEESQRIKAMAAKVNKDLSQQKALLESQKKTIARLTAEKESLATTSKTATSAKEREQLKEFKEKLKKYEEENASVKTELAGANERNDNLRDKLRQFQKVIATHKLTEKSLIERYAVLEGKLTQMREERSSSQPESTNLPEAPPSVEAQQTQDAGNSKVTDDSNAVTENMQVDASGDSVGGLSKQPDNELPLVPPGGFNFGPDRPSTAVSATKGTQPSETDGAQEALLAESKETPTVTEVGDEQPSAVANTSNLELGVKKHPPQPLASRGEGGQSTESDVEKRVVIDITGEEIPSSTDEIQDEKLEDAARLGKEQRRPSGEKKEQSLKEKLLMQKKRRLEAELAQKKAMLSARTIQAEDAVKKRALSDSMGDSEVTGEPSSKRTKPAEGSNEAESSLSGGAGPTESDGPKTESTAPAIALEELQEKVTEEEEPVKAIEQMEAEAPSEEVEFATKEADEGVNVEAKSGVESDPASTGTSVVNPFAVTASFATGDAPNKIVFGKAATESKFGIKPETVEYPTIGAFPGSSSPPPFGKSASVVLPGPAVTPAVTGFGTSSESTGVAYGSGAFLNTLKPPGSLPIRTFSFGKAGPITLPTPAIPLTNASPFDVFPSADATQASGTRTQQLFGHPLSATESETTNFPEETAEDSANQDAAMGVAEDDDDTLII